MKILYGKNQITEKPLYLERQGAKSSCGFIVGRSRTGKTYFIKKEILSVLDAQNHVFVIHQSTEEKETEYTNWLRNIRNYGKSYDGVSFTCRTSEDVAKIEISDKTKLVIFEIIATENTDDIYSAVIDKVWKLVKQNPSYSWIYFDEAELVFNHSCNAIEKICQLSRLSRKESFAVTCLFQNADSFSCESAKPFFHNAGFAVFLSQDDESIKKESEIYQFPEDMKELLFNVSVAEGMILFGEKLIPFSFRNDGRK